MTDYYSVDMRLCVHPRKELSIEAHTGCGL
jgi:hypothetical protein